MLNSTLNRLCPLGQFCHPQGHHPELIKGSPPCKALGWANEKSLTRSSGSTSNGLAGQQPLSLLFYPPQGGKQFERCLRFRCPAKLQVRSCQLQEADSYGEGRLPWRPPRAWGVLRSHCAGPHSAITAVTTRAWPLAAFSDAGDGRVFFPYSVPRRDLKLTPSATQQCPKPGLQQSTPCQAATQRPGSGVIEPHPTKGYAGGLPSEELWGNGPGISEGRMPGSKVPTTHLKVSC